MTVTNLNAVKNTIKEQAVETQILENCVNQLGHTFLWPENQRLVDEALQIEEKIRELPIPENWKMLRKELARINNKSPYMKLAGAILFLDKKPTYKNLHHAYNSILKALKKDPDNLVFLLKKLEIQREVINLGKLVTREYFDFCDEIIKNLQICAGEEPSDLLQSYSKFYVSAIDKIKDYCFKTGLVKSLKTWTEYETTARELINERDPYDLDNIAYLVDCFGTLGDDVSRWFYTNLLEKSLDEEETLLLDDYVDRFGENELYTVLVECLDNQAFDETRIYPALGKTLDGFKNGEEDQYDLLDAMIDFEFQILYRNTVFNAREEIMLNTQSLSYAPPFSSSLPEPRSRNQHGLQVL